MKPVIAALLGVASLAFAVGFAVAAVNPKAGWVDPDAGRPEAEVRAEQEARSKEFFAQYAAWIREQNGRGLDFRKLPASPLLASYVGPSLTLHDTVARSDRWLSGQVVALTFLPSGGSEVVVRVGQGSSDSPDSDVKVQFPGGLTPDANWAPTLAIAEAAPLVFPGDKVVLILERDEASQVLMPAMWTGVYLLSASGGIHAVPQNPYAKEVEAGSGVAFEERLAAEFSRKAAPQQAP